MAKIVRKTQTIFASGAAGSQIGVIGSLAAGSVAYSTDPAVLQSLSNYVTGLFGIVIGGNSPCIEDFNALLFLITYQLAYLMQAGTAEWDSGTTYYIGSQVNDGAGNIYTSKTNANLNNALSSSANWSVGQSIGNVPVGTVLGVFSNLSGAYTCSATTVADSKGFVLCQGQTVADTSSPMNGAVIPDLSSGAFLRGSTTAGGTGGSATATLSSANLGAHTHTFTSSTSVAQANHTHNFSHVHMMFTVVSSGGYNLIVGNTAATPSSVTTVGSTDIFFSESSTATAASGGSVSTTDLASANRNDYTTGVISAPSGSGATATTSVESADATVSGTTNSTGSGTAFSILPPYVNAVYIMRIK